MGTNIPPQPKIDQIVWFENHILLWEASPSSFGLTALQLNALQIATENARVAYDAAQNAKLSARTAVIAQDQQVRTMLGLGRDAVNVIKATIEQSNNPVLWGQAGLMPPDPAGTAPAPTAPFALAAALDSTGSLTITWKARQPRGVTGVVYFLRRSIDGGPFTLVDTVGEKTYTDSGVLSGTVTVEYIIQARRGTQQSPPSEALNIRFGHKGGGAGASGADEAAARTIASITSGSTSGNKVAA